MKLSRLLQNLISSPRCVFCMEDLDVRSAHNWCGACVAELPYSREPACEVCGSSMDIVRGERICILCRERRPRYARCVSTFAFRGKAAEALRYMKFGREQIWAAKALGLFLAQTVRERYGDIPFDGVVFAPMDRAGLMERGFNQAEVLARVVCRETELPLCRGKIVKVRETLRQSTLGHKARWENVKNAFSVEKAEEIRDKTLLLIDDIATTGATLDECARVLRRSGASVVYCATVARTPGKYAIENNI